MLKTSPARMIRCPRVALAVLALCFASLPAGGATAPRAPATGPTWDLRDLYPTPEAWAAALQSARERVQKLDVLKGTLGDSAVAMRTALGAISDLRREADRLSVYANLGADEDTRVALGQQRRTQGQELTANIAERTAWVAPELLALGESKVRAFLGEDEELRRRFGFSLDNTLRRAAHTLGAEAEAVLAASGLLLAQPENVFGQLSDAELPRPKVRLSNGKLVSLDLAAYEQHRDGPVRADRQRVMGGFLGSLRAFRGTFGANLNARVIGDIYAARARHFGNSLEAALYDSNMPVEVYRQLVAQTHAALPTLHRYLRLRQRMLGIQGPLAYHDNYPPLVPQPPGLRFDIEASKVTTLAALAPMGDEYLAALQRGFAGRWMHAPPQTGKASGAYMAGSAYEVHPYLLLNHTDDYASLSTFAHEWGHAVHTLLTVARQPYENADYSTFIAESASIANEMLLNDHMVATARNRAEKMFFLSQGLESIRTTFFRQVLFADFQLAMHEEVEAGKALSGQRLDDMYCGLLKQYYGEAGGVMKIDPAYCTEWAYIGHFYYGYYVYQYATSMVGAAQFTDAILRDGAPARERFVTLLKAGGSDYPYELYRRAGIDMAQPAPYQALMLRMNRLLDEFEALAGPAAR
jgi:oligoendopeptidase F